MLNESNEMIGLDRLTLIGCVHHAGLFGGLVFVTLTEQGLDRSWLQIRALGRLPSGLESVLLQSYILSPGF